jgi:hypothetical protein
MAEGVDYAWSKPTPAALKAAGKVFACRYLSNPGNGKNLTAGEARSLTAAGVSIVANWEWSAGDAKLGKAMGAEYARQARTMATACGMPPNRPIFFSVDFDMALTDIPAVRAYFAGIRSVLGAAGAGIYGGYRAVALAVSEGWCDWYWQTYAWSAGRWHSRAHIQQYRNGVTLAGVDLDLDRAMVPDYGQWQIGQVADDMALNEQQDGALSVGWQDAASWLHGYDTAPGGGGPHWGVRAVKAMQADLVALRQIAAQPPAVPVALTAEQLAQVADLVVAKLSSSVELAFRKSTP